MDWIKMEERERTVQHHVLEGVDAVENYEA